MAQPEDLIKLVGGQDTVSTPIEQPQDLVRLIRQGLPIEAVDYLLKQQWISATELDRIILSRKTLSHRRRLGHLTADQSDRLLRLVRILALAKETFGHRDKAMQWLRRSNRVLGEEAPLELLDTDIGARQVETLLGRIAHGIAA